MFIKVRKHSETRAKKIDSILQKNILSKNCVSSIVGLFSTYKLESNTEERSENLESITSKVKERFGAGGFVVEEERAQEIVAILLKNVFGSTNHRYKRHVKYLNSPKFSEIHLEILNDFKELRLVAVKDSNGILSESSAVYKAVANSGQEFVFVHSSIPLLVA